MLLSQLIERRIQPQLGEGVLQKLQDGGLVVGLQEHLSEAQPKHVLDQHVHGVVILINALLRDHV